MRNSVSFISTKLKMPAPRKNYIRREALVKKLESVLEYKVSLIQGSAGSGKTTLLTSFIKENSHVSFKWITMDADTNVFSFWYYFLEATKGYLGKEKDNIFTLFESILHKEDIEKIVVILINQLSLAEDFAIVLDDFHHLNDEYLLETIQFFVKNSPDNVHLILLTRERPALYLGELIMSGQLLEIAEDDLKFSFDEGVRFLKDTLNKELDSQMLAKISDLAEGWVGGLQLIALALANNRDGLIKNIKVLNKYIVEYLSREILAALSLGEKDFLIKTSVLSYFNEYICNQVLEQENSQEIIDRLLEKNLFIIDINEGEAYRYHNIFDEFLKLKFSQLDPKLKEQIHCQAAVAYEKISDLDESVKHYFMIENYQEALGVIEKIGQNPKGWSYLSQIPLQLVAKNKELILQRFFYHYCNLELDKCQETLQFLGNQTNDSFSSIFSFATALLEQRNIEVDLNFLAELNKMELGNITKAIILLNIAAFLALEDKYEKALELAGQVIATDRSSNNPYLRFFALTLISQIKEELGDLKESKEIYEQTFQFIAENPLLAPLAANNYIGVAGIYLKSFNLAMAEQSLEKASQAVKKIHTSLEMAYLINLIELKCLAGKIEDAKEIIKLNASALQKNSLFFPMVFRQLAFLKADSEILDSFINLCSGYREQKSFRVEEKLLYTQVLMLQNKAEEALELVDQVLEFTRRKKIKMHLIQGLLLKMSILDHLGGRNNRQILNLLREAIYYSCENNIISPYIFQKEVVNKHLAQLREERAKDMNLKEKSFLSELLGILHHEKTDSLLTEREVEVLSVIASGATNKEIAQTLCISIATVKTHIINIYSKLQVANRVEAVEKARKEGLLN